jgi:hypothetical protein
MLHNLFTELEEELFALYLVVYVSFKLLRIICQDVIIWI